MPPSFARLATTDPPPPPAISTQENQRWQQTNHKFLKCKASVNQVQKSIPDLTINESCVTRRGTVTHT